MTLYRTSFALGGRFFGRIATVAELWTALRSRIAGAFDNDFAESCFYPFPPLDDRTLRDIGVTRHGAREKTVTDRIELEVRRRSA